ncbi:BRCA1 C Terminus (BRCT) domain-containing protein [Rhodospirillales bacterium URHD0017]|nr:BRCA1 C Terminus (BRCT) domain-containing protein [Rhodospirillales bacterium URHD0017]
MDNAFFNRVGAERISARQIDELIGIACGIAADGVLNQAEGEFLHKWLVANVTICEQPVIRTLYVRVREALSDGVLDADECRDLLETLNALSNSDFELGEVLKPTTLPLDNPEPVLVFAGRHYCFTGTFSFGPRKACENAVIERGGSCGAVSKKTNVLVIGAYATDSWKHSSFGTKIIRASELRDAGQPIALVSEKHWTKFL